MPSVDSGLEGPGIVPKPEEQSIDSDAGWRKHLESQPGGDSLPVSARDWGAPNSAHRKAYVQREMDAGQEAAEARVASLAEFQAVITGPGAGNVQAGLELPDDSPPAPAPVEDTAEVDRLKGELTAARGSLSEAQQHEATMLAYDSLEEAVDSTDVHNALSELREHLPAEQWSAFKLEAIGGGLVDPEELAEHEAQYDSERVFETAFDAATKSAAEADALKQGQLEALSAEQKRLGMDDETFADHLQGIAFADQQLGVGLAGLPAEQYGEALKKVSGLVGEYDRAQRNAEFQNAVLGSEHTVESGLTIGGMPLSPRLEITPEHTFDFRRVLASEGIGKKVDVAAGVEAEAKHSTSKTDAIAALARKVDRDLEARQARARKAGF